MSKQMFTTGLVLLCLPLLAGCTTVKFPNMDFIKLPEFQEDLENVQGYPEPGDAPELPTDVRSDAAWDKAAKNLQNLRDNFTVPAAETAQKTDAEFARDVEALKAKVKAYKLDDPAE